MVPPTFMRVRSFWLLIVVTGCLDQPGVPCGNATCAPGRACDAIHGRCVAPEQLSSCEGQDAFTACRFPGQDNGRCFEGTCFAAGCGNGFVEPDEVCDDGNNASADGCSADCQSDETCGNGVVDSARGEGCDDGNTLDGDGCQSTCIVPTCGDGVIDTAFNEVCDCGQDPTALPAGCSDTNGPAPDATCRDNCQPRACGDGIVDPMVGEECDDGNTVRGDGCAATCRKEVCGNGRIDVVQVEGGFDPVEDCDDANDVERDGCDSHCAQAPRTWARVMPPSVRNLPTLVYDAGRAVTVLLDSTDAVWEWEGYTWRRIEAPVGPFSIPLPAAYDHARRMTVAIDDDGGTWGWDGHIWRLLTIAGDGPPPRGQLVYDPIHQQIISIGGTRAIPNNLLATTEIWTWDGVLWTQVVPVGDEPSAIGTIAYDLARQKVVMAGVDDQVWQWDGERWAGIRPQGERPTGSAAMIYDPSREHVMLLAGTGEVWEWLGTRWNRIPTLGGLPNDRVGHSAVYETARHAPLLFGGRRETNGRMRTDSWSLVGNTWRRNNVRNQPDQPLGPALAYDARRGRAVLFSEATRALWEWNGREWVHVTPGGDLPAGGGYHLTYHAARERIVLVGTIDGVIDHWEWDGAELRSIPTTARPKEADCRSLGYDLARNTLVLLTGGPAGDCFGAATTWLWDGTAWRDSGQAGMAPGAPLAYDPTDEQLVLFGGLLDPTTGRGPRKTWSWNGATWVDISPRGPTPPFGPYALAFDGARRRLILLAGRFGGTWEWLGHGWRQVTVANDDGLSAIPEPNAMTYDALRGQMVFVDPNASATWLSAHYAVGAGACQAGMDPDGDGLTGCDDPDCWGFCNPSCPPGAECNNVGPHCGDATCDPVLESCRLCSADCGECAPVCGDYLCEADETPESCPADCRRS